MAARELDRRGRRYLLAVVALALMMVVSAVSGLNVALPDLARATGATQTQLTWIVDAYTMTFAGTLLLIGAVGDAYGRKGVLMSGLTTFGGAALAAVFVSDPALLIALRVVMGLGAAGVMPVTLSVITTTFPPEERGQAVGVWAGMAGAGAVLGLFATGLLLEVASWHSFFVLNVALAVAALVGTTLYVPAGRDGSAARLDVVGGVLSLALVAGLVFGIIEGAERGWADGTTVTGLVVGAAGAVGFVLWELRTPAPLLDVRLFARRGFSIGSLNLTVQFFCSFGLFFVSLQYLQYVVGQSPLRAAVSLLPLPVVLIPLARTAPGIADRIGINRTGGAGLALMAAGLGVLSTVGVQLDHTRFALGLVLFAAGMGLSGTPATTAVVSSLPPSKQGVASAMNDVSREFGSALGIAVLGSILNTAYRDGVGGGLTAGLPAQLAEQARASVAFLGHAPLDQLGSRGQALADGARSAFLDGVSAALGTAALVAAVAAVVVLLLAPHHETAPSDESDERDEREPARPPA